MPSDLGVPDLGSRVVNPCGEISRGQKVLNEEPREMKEPKKQGTESQSDDLPCGEKRKAKDNAGGDTKRIMYEGRFVKPELYVGYARKPEYKRSFRKSVPPTMEPKLTGKISTLETPVGLHNFGLTCFSSAVLQCLDKIPEFVDFYHAKAKEAGKTEETCALTKYQKMQLSSANTKEMLVQKLKARKWFESAKDTM